MGESNPNPKSQEPSVNDFLSALSGSEARRPLTPLRPRGEAPPSVVPVAEEPPPPSASDKAFIDVCAKLRAEPQKPNAVVLTILILLAILWLARARNSFAGLVILALVLLLHELGQLVAMRIFGVANVRLFFLPLLGVATVGQAKERRPGHEATAALAGPLPGLILGLVLLLLPAAHHASLVQMTAAMLLGGNAISLLPFEPFDGGRVLTALFFARHYVLEGYFRIAAAFGVIWLGRRLDMGFLLYFIAGVLFISTRAHVGFSKSGAEFRKRWGEIPPILETAPEPYLLALFTEAKRFRVGAPNVAALANIMRTIHGRAAIGPASVLATAVLLGIYGVACVISLLITL